MDDHAAPPHHKPADLAGYLEALSRPVFHLTWLI